MEKLNSYSFVPFLILPLVTYNLINLDPSTDY